MVDFYLKHKAQLETVKLKLQEELKEAEYFERAEETAKLKEEFQEVEAAVSVLESNFQTVMKFRNGLEDFEVYEPGAKRISFRGIT